MKKIMLLVVVAVLMSSIALAENATKQIEEVKVTAQVNEQSYSLKAGNYNVKITLPSFRQYAGPLITAGIIIAGILIYWLAKKSFY